MAIGEICKSVKRAPRVSEGLWKLPDVIIEELKHDGLL